MHIPVVHAGSVLPVLGGADCEEAAHLAQAELADGFRCRERSVETNFECYVRRVQALDYEIAWVDLLEIDGVAPYSYSEVRLRVRVRSRPTPTRRRAPKPKPDPKPNPHPNAHPQPHQELPYDELLQQHVPGAQSRPICPYISLISFLYLPISPYISPISPLSLPYLSPVSPLYLPYIFPVPGVQSRTPERPILVVG